MNNCSLKFGKTKNTSTKKERAVRKRGMKNDMEMPEIHASWRKLGIILHTYISF